MSDKETGRYTEDEAFLVQQFATKHEGRGFSEKTSSGTSAEAEKKLEQLREDMRKYLGRVNSIVSMSMDPYYLPNPNDSAPMKEFKEKMALQFSENIDKEIRFELGGIQSFEQFEQEIKVVGPKLLAQADRPEVRVLFPDAEGINTENWTDEERQLFGAPKTDSGLNATRARLLTEAVEHGDLVALERIPRRLVSRTVVEYKLDKDLAKEYIEKSSKSGDNLDSLTSSVYNVTRGFYNPFVDENTGGHIGVVSPGQGNTWLLQTGPKELIGEVDRLVEFLCGQRMRINREIVLSDEFTKAVEAAKVEDPERENPNTLKSLQLLYYRMEIKHADEVVPLGHAIEELYQMQDSFKSKFLKQTPGS